MFSSSQFVVRSSLRCCASAGRNKHTVRVILTQDVGESQSGDVLHVKAGYARNYLIPKKMALYAIQANFERLGKIDPDIETPEERRERLVREAANEANVELVAANLLRKYLRNKVVKIWRNVDRATNTVHPGLVTAENVKQKLSKQLKIDLDEEERVHILAEPVESHDNMTEDELDALMESIQSTAPCDVKLRELGMFVAKISLAGGYSVPLKFLVLKR